MLTPLSLRHAQAGANVMSVRLLDTPHGSRGAHDQRGLTDITSGGLRIVKDESDADSTVPWIDGRWWLNRESTNGVQLLCRSRETHTNRGNRKHRLRNFWRIDRGGNGPRGIVGVNSAAAGTGQLMSGPVRLDPKTTERQRCDSH
jgi:hypothetical protein